MQSISSDRFDVRGGRSRVAHFLLAVSALTAALLIAATVWQRGVEQPTPLMIGAQTAALVLTNAIALAAAFAVATWVERAYSNLAHLGAEQTYSPGAAAAYFLIPGANFIVPHTVLRQIWRGSEPTTVRTLTRPPWRPLNLVALWWYLFIASTFLGNLAVLFGQSPRMQAQSGTVLMAAAAGSIAAALLGMDVIRLIDTRQAQRRSAQPLADRGAGRSANTSPAVEPEPPSRPGWREALLPVVTAVESEVAREKVFEELTPLPFLEPAHEIPADLAAPSSLAVSVLFGIVAVLAALQAILSLILGIAAPAEAGSFGLTVAVVPFSLPIYVLSLAGGVAFSAWLTRAYSNLQAYMPVTPRSPFDAAHDFFRRAGDPAVVEEVCLATMSASGTSPMWRIEAWGSAWRTLRVSIIVAVAFLIVSRGRFTTVVFALMFAVWWRAAVLTRRVAIDVSMAQRDYLKQLSSAVPSPAPRSETEVPSQLP